MFRSMRRFRQELTQEECREVLAQQRRGCLALQGDDGYPYALPINFWFDPESGHVYFHGAPAGHKIDAMKRSDKVSFCVFEKTGAKREDDWAETVRSVICFGRLEVVTDPGRKERALRQIGLRYYPSAGEVEDEIRQTIGRVAVLELSVEHMSGKRVHER